MVNEHITSLGYRLEFAEDESVIKPLLEACDLEFVPESENPWHQSEYLMACTQAGGLAACVGWSRHERHAILHSLGVAPSSRGSGVGAGILATAMGHVMDSQPVESFYLTTTSGAARRLFASMGFVVLEDEELPEHVAEHPIFDEASDSARSMIRDYTAARRGLDNFAFRLVHNDTPEATTPLGSVFFFKQTGSVIEANYRGDPVVRGHLLGAIDGDDLHFCWHHFTRGGRLMSGDGNITLETLPDGRRELRETFKGSGELLLREV